MSWTVPGESIFFAYSQSAILTWLYVSFNRRLPGLISRWTQPTLWMIARAAEINMSCAYCSRKCTSRHTGGCQHHKMTSKLVTLYNGQHSSLGTIR